MTTPLRPVSIQQIGDALVRGDRVRGRLLLDELRGRGDADRPSWLTIAQLEQAMGDDVAADEALLRHLAVAPRDLVALLLLGGLRAKRGDDRTANNFYRAALAAANLVNTTLPPAIAALLSDARSFVDMATRRFANHLERTVGDGNAQEERRIRLAIDLLMERSELYLQRPSMFYFPELPQRAFFDRKEFAWLPRLEAAIPDIRDELHDLMADESGFAPYVQQNAGQAPPANPLLNDPSWSAGYLWRGGERVSAMADRCPATMAALDEVPMPAIAGRSPMAMFSILRPGTHIRPHHGLLNTRLICHLPILTPSECALRVGAETREWREGETLIFDDSIEHEAWNRGDGVRAVLLFEIWRPELSSTERTTLTGIFEAIDDYQGSVTDNG